MIAICNPGLFSIAEELDVDTLRSNNDDCLDKMSDVDVFFDATAYAKTTIRLFTFFI